MVICQFGADDFSLTAHLFQELPQYRPFLASAPRSGFVAAISAAIMYVEASLCESFSV